ncbi:hypothetical protein [Candidatus Regiella insecticola]|uniref:Uncharacterized protein n=1 Tax=Candidatus Regiella insecticola TaxID=138073 RepID=A0A6L2ZMP0_9ENTR|nr:hypothetical protein [Candidatus Regiella insecticola]GFN46137.1 hypothetical protein RINTU1_15790 [Candidatus Regiella insecticola]
MFSVSNHTQAAPVKNSYFVITEIFTTQNKQGSTPVLQLRHVGNNYFTLYAFLAESAAETAKSLREELTKERENLTLIINYQDRPSKDR